MTDEEILVARRQRALIKESPKRIRWMVPVGANTVEAVCAELAATWPGHPLVDDKLAILLALQRHNAGEFYGAFVDSAHPFHEVDAMLRAVFDEPRGR